MLSQTGITSRGSRGREGWDSEARQRRGAEVEVEREREVWRRGVEDSARGRHSDPAFRWAASPPSSPSPRSRCSAAPPPPCCLPATLEAPWQWLCHGKPPPTPPRTCSGWSCTWPWSCEAASASKASLASFLLSSSAPDVFLSTYCFGLCSSEVWFGLVVHKLGGQALPDLDAGARLPGREWRPKEASAGRACALPMARTWGRARRGGGGWAVTSVLWWDLRAAASNWSGHRCLWPPVTTNLTLGSRWWWGGVEKIYPCVYCK